MDMEHASFRHRPLEQAFVRALAGIGIDPGENGKPQAQSGQHHHVLTERHHARADEHEMAGRRYSYPTERTTADTVRESTFSEMSLDRRREALALRQTRAATVDDPWLARLQRRWDESDPAKAGSTHIADSHTTGASHDSQAWRHHQYAGDGRHSLERAAARDDHRPAACMRHSHASSARSDRAHVHEARGASGPRGASAACSWDCSHASSRRTGGDHGSGGREPLADADDLRWGGGGWYHPQLARAHGMPPLHELRGREAGAPEARGREARGREAAAGEWRPRGTHREAGRAEGREVGRAAERGGRRVASYVAAERAAERAAKRGGRDEASCGRVSLDVGWAAHQDEAAPRLHGRQLRTALGVSAARATLRTREAEEGEGEEEGQDWEMGREPGVVYHHDAVVNSGGATSFSYPPSHPSGGGGDGVGDEDGNESVAVLRAQARRRAGDGALAAATAAAAAGVAAAAADDDEDSAASIAARAARAARAALAAPAALAAAAAVPAVPAAAATSRPACVHSRRGAAAGPRTPAPPPAASTGTAATDSVSTPDATTTPAPRRVSYDLPPPPFEISVGRPG